MLVVYTEAATAEQVRACADAILAQSEDLPAGAFALTFTERRIRGFLRELCGRLGVETEPAKPDRVRPRPFR